MNDSAAAEPLVTVRALPWRNFGLSLLSKLGALAAHVVFVMATARLFSKEEVAVVAMAGILSIVLDVCKGFGLGTLLLKRLPQYPDAESEEARSLVFTYLFYSTFPALVIGCALLCIPRPLVWLGLDASGSLGWSFQWGLLASVFIVLSNTNTLVLQASERFGELAALNLWTAALQRLAPCLAALWFGFGLEPFLLASALSSAAGFVLTCLPLIGWLPLGQGRTRILRFDEFWPESRHFYTSSLLRFGAMQVDQLAVAALFPPATLAVYFMLRRLYSIVAVLVGSMIDALMPELSRQAATDLPGARRRLAEWFRLFMAAGTVGAALIAGNGPIGIGLMLGPGYAGDATLIGLFAAATSLYFVYCFVQVDLMLFQEPGRVMWMTAATAAANLILGPAAAPWLGVSSIPLAMLLGYLMGLAAASWHARSGALPRPVWRLRDLTGGLTVVALASLAPGLIRHLVPGDFLRLAGVNLIIAVLTSIYLWQSRAVETLRRLRPSPVEAA